MPALTGRDEPWPFFHFWRHHFWPKMLNFCRRKRSLQWCPDQSDRLNGATMRKTKTKICCLYTWLLHGKNWTSRWRFLRSFLTASKPSRRSITAAKTKEEEKGKHSINRRRRRRRRSSQNFDFCACPSQNVVKRDASGMKAKLSWCKGIFDQIKVNLAEIQPKNHQNVERTPFSQKAPGVNGLKAL